MSIDSPDRQRLVSDAPSRPLRGVRDLDAALLLDDTEGRDGVPLEREARPSVFNPQAIVPKADLGQREVQRRGGTGPGRVSRLGVGSRLWAVGSRV